MGAELGVATGPADDVLGDGLAGAPEVGPACACGGQVGGGDAAGVADQDGAHAGGGQGGAEGAAESTGAVDEHDAGCAGGQNGPAVCRAGVDHGPDGCVGGQAGGGLAEPARLRGGGAGYGQDSCFGQHPDQGPAAAGIAVRGQASGDGGVDAVAQGLQQGDVLQGEAGDHGAAAPGQPDLQRARIAPDPPEPGLET
ncbi:hypothetical protein LWF15_15090 [Kineosporia rhizophila]|nr:MULTISPECIES: hypothetical protein [Kineosporia]MCE0536831.1 hypothetical protein [Kineosporia rhizophila]GLY13016.1 hypothetical protein Kisp01_00320 [Kineosporia sp. NBRC 101677]